MVKAIWNAFHAYNGKVLNSSSILRSHKLDFVIIIMNYVWSMEEQPNASPYLPGAASLLEQLDKRIMIILRDGKHLVGKLRSFDHFMNLILEETFERLIHSGLSFICWASSHFWGISIAKHQYLQPFVTSTSGKYCDVPLGLYVVRGDSIVLLGELDAEKEEASTKLEKIQPRDFIALSADIPDSSSKVEWDFESWWALGRWTAHSSSLCSMLLKVICLHTSTLIYSI